MLAEVKNIIPIMMAMNVSPSFIVMTVKESVIIIANGVAVKVTILNTAKTQTNICAMIAVIIVHIMKGTKQHITDRDTEEGMVLVN